MKELSEEKKDFIEMMIKTKPKLHLGYIIFKKKINGKNYKIKRSRALIQLYLNKELDIWELVHHKDKNKQNDDIANLEILNTEEHTSIHRNKLGKKPKNWKPANTLKPETIKRIKEISKEMIKINFSEISRRMNKEGINVSNLTISKYIREY